MWRRKGKVFAPLVGKGFRTPCGSSVCRWSRIVLWPMIGEVVTGLGVEACSTPSRAGTPSRPSGRSASSWLPPLRRPEPSRVTHHRRGSRAGGHGAAQEAGWCGHAVGAGVRRCRARPSIGRSPHSTRAMMADALDCRHRLPKLWARLCAGDVPVRLPRHVAQQTRGLTTEAAGRVDSSVVEHADGRLSWSRFETLVAGKIVEPTPRAPPSTNALRPKRSSPISAGATITDRRRCTSSPASPLWRASTLSCCRPSPPTAPLHPTTPTPTPTPTRVARPAGVAATQRHSSHLSARTRSGPTPASVAGSTRGPCCRRCRCTCTSTPAQTPVRSGSWPDGKARPGHRLLRAQPARPRIPRSRSSRWSTLREWPRWNGYPVPDRLREVVHLRTPADVFPYAANVERRNNRITPGPTFLPTTAAHQARPDCTTSAR